MKRNTPLLLFILMECLLFAACKKNDNRADNWQMPMIKTETANNNVISYWYNNQARVVKLENGDWVKVDYTYTRDSVFYKTTEIATNAVQKESGKLDANGMLVSQGGRERKYDDHGRLTEEFFPPGSNGWQRRYRHYYNSVTGLLDSSRQTESKLLQTRWMQTTIYTYYTDHTNTLGNENKGMGFLGKSDLHPVRHSETWRPVAAVPFREITNSMDIQYGYDEQGRIVVEDRTEHRLDNTIAQWRTVYTYY